MSGMLPLKNGDIVLVPFPFTDLSQTKLRPALIVSTETVHKTCDDISVIFISSVIPDEIEEYEYRLITKHPEFVVTGLKKESLFKMNKLVTVSRSLVKNKLGKVGAKLRRELGGKFEKAVAL